MPGKVTTNVAAAILKEVPLSRLGTFVSNMAASENGTGCGGGCGGGCSETIDRFGHVLDAASLKSAAADKPALMKAIQAQAADHLKGL